MEKICKICGNKFILKSNKAHRRVICYNKHYYKCDYCNKSFILSQQQCWQIIKNKNKKYFCSLQCSCKYGNCTRNINEVIDKMNKTCLSKYGVIGYNNRDKFKVTSKQNNIWIKSHLTKKLNNSYGKSVQEDIFYNYIIDNTNYKIQRQVIINGMSFDFKVNNILVELNGNYYHNNKPFNNTIEDINKYNDMKNKQGQISVIADTWRYRDVNKLNYCKENNIPIIIVYFDYIEFLLPDIVNYITNSNNSVILRFNKDKLIEEIKL